MGFFWQIQVKKKLKIIAEIYKNKNKIKKEIVSV